MNGTRTEVIYGCLPEQLNLALNARRVSLSLAQLEFQARVLVYWNKCADNLFYYLFMSSLFFADLICSHSKINFT